MAFLAYFAALSAMGAFVFGLSVLLEPSPVPSSLAKKTVAEQKVNIPLPPPRPVAVKPTDETVTEPAAAVTAQVVQRDDDEAAPSAPQNATLQDTAHQDTAHQDSPQSAMASAPPPDASAPAASPVEKPKARKTVRKKAPAISIAREDGATRTLRYVGVRDGIPTYVVER